MRAYYRMLSGIDRVIGRIREELDRLHLAENTVIIYTSDNGYYMGDRGLAGKWSHYDQSLRAPMIVFDPRLDEKDRGQVRTELVLNVDIAPTVLALARVESPALCQGRSVHPLLSRKSTAPGWRSDFFCEHLMQHADIPRWEGIRGERYVYARYFEQEPVFEFLHDLETDPDQLVNLASHPDHRDVLERMRARCDELKEEYTPTEQKDASREN
jgi:arylsulfatase A-like enzyme